MRLWLVRWGPPSGHMVGALTVGKKKYADVEDEMMELMKEGRQLQRELLDLGAGGYRYVRAPVSAVFSKIGNG